MKTTRIWQTEATPAMKPVDAVREFTRTYWQEPRRAFPIDQTGVFRLHGGRNTYRVVLDDGVWPNIYAIEIVEDAA